LKIALVRRKYSPYGGAERYLEDLSIHLSRMGHEIHIFSSHWTSPNDIPSIIVHRVPMIHGQGLIELMTFNRNVDHTLHKESFDITQSLEKIFFQDLYHGQEGCHRQWLLQRRRYEPFMNRMGIRLNPFHWMTMALEKRLFEKSPTKYFIAISNRGQEEIMTHYPQAKDRIRVIYNGLELKRPVPLMEPKDWRRKIEKTILFVGSGFFRKGLFFLIKALPEIQKTGAVQLIVIGRDNQNKIKALAEKEKVTDRITWIGPVKNVAPYYQAADVLVLPSIYEPFGNVCLEAIAYGLPVVTTEAAGASEIIVPGKNGLVIKDPANIKELAEAVADALKLDREQVQKTDEMILPNFTWDQHIKNLTGLYQEVLQEKKGGISGRSSL
jgi:UDP-glucose:(heptosyl)LPS alpha-1,3-glucosyltransferase